MADKPKVQFTKADLYALVSRDLNTLKPAPPQAPANPLDNIRAAIDRVKRMPGGPPKTL